MSVVDSEIYCLPSGCVDSRQSPVTVPSWSASASRNLLSWGHALPRATKIGWLRRVKVEGLSKNGAFWTVSTRSRARCRVGDMAIMPPSLFSFPGMQPCSLSSLTDVNLEPTCCTPRSQCLSPENPPWHNNKQMSIKYKVYVAKSRINFQIKNQHVDL